MTEHNREPGVGRSERISEEGLRRLSDQLERGRCPADPVLAQWIRRYGDAARELLRSHGHYHPGLEA